MKRNIKIGTSDEIINIKIINTNVEEKPTETLLTDFLSEIEEKTEEKEIEDLVKAKIEATEKEKAEKQNNKVNNKNKK